MLKAAEAALSKEERGRLPATWLKPGANDKALFAFMPSFRECIKIQRRFVFGQPQRKAGASHEKRVPGQEPGNQRLREDQHCPFSHSPRGQGPPTLFCDHRKKIVAKSVFFPYHRPNI